ncbi:unnamed protein product [Lathyrus sativus]|nr:unnamed protein product [Lathyrus sativus]
MIQNYQYAMTVCSWDGYPNLFTTFTCNHKWSEMVDFLKTYQLRSEDRPDLVSRLFKNKLDHLVKDIKKGDIFGKVKAVIYTIEFQKRGLLHAHILAFLQPSYMFVYPYDIDKTISAEIPDKDVDPELFKIYNAHINMEWCNQLWFIKYLFKYVNKGHARVTVGFYKGADDRDNSQIFDEIKMYYDCRYLSACEAGWRIFVFDINYREPSIERMNFHLEDEQYVVFSDDASIEQVINKPYIGSTKILAWMDANKKYVEAQNLTYNEFPTKFVRKESDHRWAPR